MYSQQNNGARFRRRSTRAFRTLGALGIMALGLGTLPLTAIGAELTGSAAIIPSTAPSNPTENSNQVTESTVEFVSVALSPDYTESDAVPEAVGYAQQSQMTDAAVSIETAQSSGPEDRALLAQVDMPSDVVLVAATWDLDAKEPESVTLRYLAEGTWSSWHELEAEVGEGKGIRDGTEPYLLANADAVEVVARTSDGEDVPGLSLTVIDANEAEPVANVVEESAGAAEILGSDSNLLGGEGAGDKGEAEAENAGVQTASVTADGMTFVTGTNGLVINTRKAWGADEQLMTWKPSVKAVDGAVVHHTMSSNNYTQAQAPQQIRNIYHYHAVTLGWGDIGYNLIVDKYGGVWEGRAGGITEAIQGAHAVGSNSWTFGITVMGDYTTSAPPAVAVTALSKTIAWKLDNHGIRTADGTIWVEHEDKQGRIVARISGHRDVGYTTCPGDAFYALLPKIRTDVNRYLDTITHYDVPVERLGGANRYATNLAVNAATSPKDAPVFVASGEDFADVLSVAPAVRAHGGALYLTRSGVLPTSTLSAIRAAKPSHVYVVGGPGAVSDKVIDQLKTEVPSARSVARIGGADRYDTSALILEEFFGDGDNERIFVATGTNFPDALSAAAAAGTLGSPVLLVNGSTGTVSSAAANALVSGTAKKTLVVVGGEGVVSPAAASGVADIANGATVIRLSGNNRYKTNLAVNDYLSQQGASATTGMWVATGRDFPDALSAAVPAAGDGQRLVLSPGTCLPSPVVSSWITSADSQITKVTLVGGQAALSAGVQRLAECQG